MYQLIAVHKRYLVNLLILFSFLFTSTVVPAQGTGNLPPQVIAWPDTVLINGKIVTVNNDGFNSNPGTTVQAMAVRDGRVLALGSNVEIGALVGPQTDRIDLQGRTVIPGIIDTHSHLFQYANHRSRPRPEGLEPSLPGWDSLEGDYTSWEEIIDAIHAEVRRRAEVQEPGTRIFFQVPEEGYTWRGEYITKDPFLRYTLGLSLPQGVVMSEEELHSKPMSRIKMDEITRDHYVHVLFRTDGIGNSRMIQYAKDLIYGPVMDPGVIETEQTGLTSNSFNRVMMGEFLEPFMNQVKYYKQENQLVAAMGMTTFSSNIRSLTHVAAYQYLDALGEIIIRFGYGPSSGTPPQVLPEVLAEMGSNFNPVNTMFGTEYMWYVGTGTKSIDAGFPHMTTSLEPPQIPQNIKDREFSVPNNRAMLEIVDYYVKRGNRFINTHVAGDGALDMLLETLEEATRDGGLSLDYLRSKRHAIDHCALNPRPDQIEMLRRFNMIASCSPKYIAYQSNETAQDYGEEYVNWIVPMRSLIDAGVTAVFEIDEPVTRGVFFYLDLFVNREDLNGRVWAPHEKIHRVEALKSATIWATEYVGRKHDLGSLETGKLADYLVLNKDYFSIPDKMIKTVRPLMTVVGGNTVYLDPDYATELDREAVGLQPMFALEHIAIWEAEAAAE